MQAESVFNSGGIVLNLKKFNASLELNFGLLREQPSLTISQCL